MKVKELRAMLEGFEALFNECNRQPEADVLKQLDAFLKDYDSSKVLGLVESIRESRSTSGRNLALEVLKK